MGHKERNALKFCFQKAEKNVHKLYIYDDVTQYGQFNWNTWEYEESETSAKYFRDQLEQIPEEDVIELHISSNGGSVKEGVTILNLLKQHGAHKIGCVDGVAYSIAFVILQACEERVMNTGTSALIHDMWVTTSGNARELRKMADDLDVLMEANRKIFLERSNLEEQKLIEMMEAETYLTPEQCLEYGLIDRVETCQQKNEKEENEKEEELKSQVQQLKKMLAEQKSFREQLALLQEGRGQEKQGQVQQEPEKLEHKLYQLFQNM